MKFCWNYYIQPIADYACQLWAPSRLSEVDLLEATQRAWTRQEPALRDLHPWDRMRIMGLPSMQRQAERYKIICIWKSLEGIIPPQGGIEAKWMEYKGRKVKIPTLKTQGRIRRLREETLGVQGAHLWNSLPMQFRNYGGFDTSLQGFKSILGSYLRLVPDKPRDNQGGWFPNPVNEAGQHSNSLTHWRPWLQKRCPYYSWTGSRPTQITDHIMITDQRVTDHTVTGRGEVRKARQGSNDNWEELGEHPASNPQLSPAQPTAQPRPSNPVRDNLASYNLGEWPQAVSYFVTYE